MAVGTPFSLGQLPRTFQGVNSSGAFVDVYTINADGTITFNTAVTIDVVLSAVLSIAEGGTGATTASAALAALGPAATAAEIDNAADVSARMVAAGATLAVTVAAHAGKIIQLDTLAGSVCTLPAAAGTGARFEFVTTVLATSNSHIVKVNATPGTDIMVGRATVADAADDSQTTFVTTATSDTITFNRTTTGSVRIGERIVCVDVKAGYWAVDVVCVGTGGEATPFSATVP